MKITLLYTESYYTSILEYHMYFLKHINMTSNLITWYEEYDEFEVWTVYFELIWNFFFLFYIPNFACDSDNLSSICLSQQGIKTLSIILSKYSSRRIPSTSLRLYSLAKHLVVNVLPDFFKIKLSDARCEIASPICSKESAFLRVISTNKLKSVLSRKSTKV